MDILIRKSIARIKTYRALTDLSHSIKILIYFLETKLSYIHIFFLHETRLHQLKKKTDT